MNKKPVLLAQTYKDHTVQNAINNLEMGNLPQSAFDVHLQPIRNILITVQVLDDNTEEVIETITGKARSGSVKADSSSLIRRTASLELQVDDDTFPKNDSLIWFNKKIKMYAGIKDMSKVNEYVNFLLGTFWIDEANYSVDVSGSAITLDLSDKMGQYEATKLERPLKLYPGTPVSEAIVKLMEHLGEKKFGAIAESKANEVVPYTLEFKIGDTVMDVIKKLRDMYMDYVCGYNVDGEFEYKKISIQREDEAGEPKWKFDESYNKRADTRISFQEGYSFKNIRNRVVVYGRTNDKTGATPYAEVRITDPKSPFNVYSIGEKTDVSIEDKYVTEEQCYSKARYEILKASTFQEKAVITSLPLYILNTHDFIDVIHPFTKESHRYIIDTFDYSLGVEGTMSINAAKVYYAQLEYGEEKVPLIDAIIRGISNYGWLSLGEERIRECYNIMGSGSAKINVRFHSGLYGGEQASMTSYPTTKNQTLLLDITDFDQLDMNDENGLVAGRSKGDYMDRVLGHEMVHAVMNDYMGHDIAIQLPIWFKEGFAEFIHGAKERYDSCYPQLSNENKKRTLIQRAKKNLLGDWEGISEDYVSSYLIAVAIYRICSVSQWNNLFINVKNMKNPSINFLIKLLPIADSVSEIENRIITELENMDDIWSRLNDKYEIDTMSVAGKHFMNKFGLSLTAESVFNNLDADTDSIGFEIEYLR